MQKAKQLLEKLIHYYHDGQDPEAQKLVEELRKDTLHMSPEDLSQLYLYEGLLARRAGNFVPAEAAFHELYDSGLKEARPYNQVRALHELGHLYADHQDYRRGIECYRQALHIVNSHMDDYDLTLAENYVGQGLCFLALKEFEDAERYLGLACTYAEVAQDMKTLARAKEYLGSLAYEQGDRKSMLKFYMAAAAMYQGLGCDKDCRRCQLAIRQHQA